MNIGNRIKKVRTDNKLNQTELAKLLEKSTSGISAMEKENTNITLNDIIKICNTFKVSADWLIFGTNEFYKDEDEEEFLKKYRYISERDKGRIDEIIETGMKKQEIKKIGNL